MKKDLPHLRLFDGKPIPDEFLGDLKSFTELEPNKRLEVINNTFLWYPMQDNKEEWDKWITSFPKEQQHRLLRSIRLILYLVSKGLERQFRGSSLNDELIRLEIDQSSIDLLLKLLQDNRRELELVEKGIERSPIIPEIEEVDWRINITHSDYLSDKVGEASAILRISLTSNENNEFLFELSKDEIEILIEKLNFIKNELIAVEGRIK